VVAKELAEVKAAREARGMAMLDAAAMQAEIEGVFFFERPISIL
jgi:hypothetical protein